MEWIVDHGKVPLPPKPVRQTRSVLADSKYHFADMAVGQTVEYTGSATDIGSAAHTWGNKHGIKMSFRRTKTGAAVTRLT